MDRLSAAWRAVRRASRWALPASVAIGLMMSLYFAALAAGGEGAGEPPPSVTTRAGRAALGVATGVGYGAVVAAVWLGAAAAVGWARGGGRPEGAEEPPPPKTGWRGVLAAVALVVLVAWLLATR